MFSFFRSLFFYHFFYFILPFCVRFKTSILCIMVIGPRDRISMSLNETLQQTKTDIGDKMTLILRCQTPRNEPKCPELS